MKKQKKNTGITLIALVITIIVLLILAGVSIAMLAGDNGILTQAQRAKKETEKASVIEQAQLDILEKQTEENGTTIYKEDIKEILDKYFEFVPDNVTLDTELQTKEEYGDSQIKVSEIYSGELIKRPILAGDVLITNADGESEDEKSPFVMYNNILCRVLYNDETHGLQIVSDKNIEENNKTLNITLGATDPTITGVTGELNIAMASYNNAVDTLNNKAKEYIGTKAIDARSLGSIATLKDGKFQGDTSGIFNSQYSYLDDYEFKDEDGNYTEDVNQINLLELNNGITWLASRTISLADYGIYFGVSILWSSGDAIRKNSYSFGYIYRNGGTSSYSRSYGFRPVFLLPSDIIISSGDGSEENPYIIE